MSVVEVDLAGAFAGAAACGEGDFAAAAGGSGEDSCVCCMLYGGEAGDGAVLVALAVLPDSLPEGDDTL